MNELAPDAWKLHDEAVAAYKQLDLVLDQLWSATTTTDTIAVLNEVAADAGEMEREALEILIAAEHNLHAPAEASAATSETSIADGCVRGARPSMNRDDETGKALDPRPAHAGIAYEDANGDPFVDTNGEDVFPTRDRSNLRSIEGQLWVRAGAELSLDDEVEIAMEAQTLEPTAEQRARWHRHHNALDVRRQFHRDTHNDNAGVLAAEAIDELQDAFDDLVQLQADVEARLDLTFVNIERAINGLHQVAPRGHMEAFAGGVWLPRGWNDWSLAAPFITKREIRRRVEVRREEVRQAVEERDIEWADRHKEPSDASERDDSSPAALLRGLDDILRGVPPPTGTRTQGRPHVPDSPTFGTALRTPGSSSDSRSLAGVASDKEAHTMNLCGDDDGTVALPTATSASDTLVTPPYETSGK